MSGKRAFWILTAVSVVVVSIKLFFHVSSSSIYRLQHVDEYYESVATGQGFEQSLLALIQNHAYLSNKEIWLFLEAGFEATTDSSAIVLFYTHRGIPKTNRASGEHQSRADYWNREHVWPQSKGLKGSKRRLDIHNIVPADRSVNTSRGNKFFDEGGSQHSECSECYTDRDSWEPPDSVKGDVARKLFYMDFRYGDELDLFWTNKEILFEWSCVDPVTADEVQKNDTAQKFQGNRNPFVDHPEWIADIYGVSRC